MAKGTVIVIRFGAFCKVPKADCCIGYGCMACEWADGVPTGLASLCCNSAVVVTRRREKSNLERGKRLTGG